MADCHPIAHWIFDGDLSLRGAKFSCAPSSIHKDAEEEAPDLAGVGCNPNGPQDISPGKRRIGEQDGGGTPSRSGSQSRGLLRAGNLPVILFANAASLFLFDQLRQSPCLSCRSIATGKSLQSSKSPGALVGKGRGQPSRKKYAPFAYGNGSRWPWPARPGGRERVASHGAAMSWGDSSLVRYHRRSEVVERSPATPESGSDLSLELPAIRSLRHPHRRPSRPFIGRGTTHEGARVRGDCQNGDHGAHAGLVLRLPSFGLQLASFLFPAPTRATKTWFVHALTSPGSDEHHIAGFLATLPQDGLTASKYRERARSKYANAHDDGCRPSPPGNCPRVSTSIIAWSNVVCVCLRPPRPCRSCRESTSGSRSCGGGTGQATSTS